MQRKDNLIRLARHWPLERRLAATKRLLEKLTGNMAVYIHKQAEIDIYLTLARRDVDILEFLIKQKTELDKMMTKINNRGNYRG